MSYNSSRSGEITVGPFPIGMNNKEPDHALPEGSVRNAVNVDFVNSGKGRRRQGITKVYDGVGTKAGFKRYFVEGSDLKYLNADNTSTTIYSGITGTEYAYSYFNGDVYFSDGVINKILNGTTVSHWGLPAPNSPIVARTTGTLTPGVYLAAYAFVDANGIEHGCSNIASYSTNVSGGIIFTSIPQLVSGAVTVRIYLSKPNGRELYYVTDTTARNYTVSVATYDEGYPAENLFASPPPAASIIGFYKGRAYIADSTGIVWYSNLFEYHKFNLASNYLVFPDRVTLMAPVENGIFFATNAETWFYAGVPESGFDISKKFDYGAVLGTGLMLPDSDSAIWLSQEGVVIGSKSGECENVQEANVATESSTEGSLLLREYDGVRQAVAVLKNPTTSKLAATSFIEAEIIRRT